MTNDAQHPIHALSDTLVEELCDLYPAGATYSGIPGRDHLWRDLSPAGAAAELAQLRSMRDRIDALPPTDNRWDEIAVDVARDFVYGEISMLENGDHLRDLNSIASSLQMFRDVFDHTDKKTAEGWANIATRLESLPAALVGYRELLEKGRTTGLVVATRQVDEGVRQAEVVASDQSSFLTLKQEFADSAIDDQALAVRIDAGVTGAMAAYGDLAAYLKNVYAPHASTEDAVGRERYARALYPMVGTELDLEETYAWGWTEVASLWERMQTEAEKIAPGGGVEGALQVLKTDPARAAADEAELRSFLAERIDEALERLAGSHFNVPDEIRACDVKVAPPGAALGAYYVPPSEDFSRPGSVWWSIDRSVPTPLYDEVSTAYHEGFPGHHLQCGIQVGLQDKMTRLQRVWVWQSGSGEGWALYAERLMDELGFLDTPDYVFGFLTSQMHRAVRVVVDIGSHLKLPIPDDQPFHPGEQWSFETAVEMLETYATLDTPYAVSEVNRYYGWPAQAITYKVGERAILDIRRAVEEAEGDAFDAKSFHQRLLEVGPFGLDLLRKHVVGG